MLGTVKMEGHESSDWNSYYADTQEVRRRQQAGHSRRPGEAGAGQGGRPTDWGRLLRATHPVWPRPGFGRASEPDRLPREGEKILGNSGLLKYPLREALASSLRRAGAGAGPGVSRFGGRALQELEATLRKPEFAYRGDLFPPRLNSHMSSDKSAPPLSGAS